ncbi:MAG: S-methyl-5'-thioadenosine phosphorylase [archaeon]
MAIGLIGGTGVYDNDVLKNSKSIKIKTPYGMTSDVITKGTIGNKEVFIIPRHGKNHIFNPSEVPYKANIWALKELGVTKLLSISAVGSLKEEYKPGDFVFTDQFIDRTTKRDQSFHKMIHLTMAQPFCEDLRNILISAAQSLKLSYHDKGTCVVIEGPRFSTKAESLLFKSWDADTINMTLVPEAVLAREAEICYGNISMVTDYDSWKEQVVTVDLILETMKQNIEKVRKLLTVVIPMIDDSVVCSCNKALDGAEI